jgi:hypothetical protein
MKKLIIVLGFFSEFAKAAILDHKAQSFLQRQGVTLARPEVIAEWLRNQSGKKENDNEFLVKTHCISKGPKSGYRCSVVKVETSRDR